MNKLDNKVAVVTGATGGIGKNIAVALANQNVNLFLIGNDKDKLSATELELKKTQVDVRVFNCDLNSTNDINRMAKEITDTNNKIDIMIHSAGVFIQRSFESTTIDDFNTQYNVNTRAPFLLTQLFLSSIKTQKGQIVFINSSVAMQDAKSGLSGYTASKYALKALADSLRSEVNQYGVRVLSVYPGRTATTMQEQIYKLENKEYKGDLLLQPEDIAESVVGSLLLPRTAEVTDLCIRPFIKS